MQKNGIFITLEGPEGAGKTTIINILANKLQMEGHYVIQTREPGGIDIAEQIRKVILDKGNTAMDPRTEALLYAAARRQHLVEKVKPGLEDGAVILCDRFIDSSLAYQGYARNLGIEEVYSINQFAIEDMMPEITLYFDISPEVGLERISTNNEREVNRLDLEGLKFHHKVREGYKILVERFPDRICSIDAAQPLDEVVNEAYTKVKQLLDKR